ncbi:gamma-glutamylcyclotransferase [Aliiroseovarius sp. S2029]|uniref:gamma-glutamylcyclotransferase family protein n=1 Tax=Aliiroseovarius sp. S2029 TaxID=2936988 RepID=UPI0020BF48E7|nr:gamma-glutamylcyclotransferase family protein [Aliiroseovarius sp. S2029]MCK8483073.1 gamma-glutamylcyclotransferase [Aliiroseovarius sp. S2029]
MQDPFFFGYGSLVNRRTHAFENAQPARVTGWRRAWRRSPLRKLCYLTAVPDREDYIEGMIASVPGADWAALDHRERAYRRVPLGPEVQHGVETADVAIYAIEDGKHQPPTNDNPVLLSYIDVVVQGYLAEFGLPGVTHFFETTDGWHAPILNDRVAPIYPRAQTLTEEERQIVDAGLSRLSAQPK